MQKAWVAGNAVFHSIPDDRARVGVVIIMLDGLGGTKESLKVQAGVLMRAGHAVVLADNYNEGERRDRAKEPLNNRDGKQLCQKKHFWKAIWKTAQDVPNLVDFAITTFGTQNVAAYGQSMGGDILLTALTFERRLHAVVTEVSTPNWLRPNSISNTLGEDEDSDQLYLDHCPCNNLDAFEGHPTAILCITGEEDLAVPGACTEAFVRELRVKGYYPQEQRLQHVPLPSCGSVGHAIVEDTTMRVSAFVSSMNKFTSI